MIAKLIRVTGDVQGVSYRYTTRREAEKLGITGWVQNEHDGSVTILVQGEEEALNNLIQWARDGSPMASVEDVKIEETRIDDSLKGFSVK